MMQPAELLQYFRVLRISLKDSSVCKLCSLVLKCKLTLDKVKSSITGTHVFLLLVNMADLKPNIFLSQWPRRVGHNIFEALWEGKQYSRLTTHQTIPLSSDGTFAAVYILFRDGSRSHWPSQNQVAFA